jgi:alpha-glucosidase
MKFYMFLTICLFSVNLAIAQISREEVNKYVERTYPKKGSSIKKNSLSQVEAKTLQALSSYSLESPDKKTTVKIELTANQLLYSILKNQVAVVNPSIINLQLSTGGLTDGITLNSSQIHANTETIALPYGERLEVNNNYSEMILGCNNNRNEHFNIEIRAYNEGIAFRVVLQSQNKLSNVQITNELTQFVLNETYNAYTEIYNEQGYVSRPTSTTFSSLIPLTLVGSNFSLCINEAGNEDFTRVSIRCNGSNALQTKFLSRTSDYALPYNLPWRYILIGDNPTELFNNKDMIYALNAVEYDPTQWEWLKPGKVFRSLVLSTEGAKNSIDFCQRMNIEYMMFDAGWYGLGYGKNNESNAASNPLHVIDAIDMPEVTRYAKEKDVGIILYVNKVAWYNYDNDAMFDLYKSWDIKGLKLGFVDGYSAYGIQYVTRLIKQAAENQMVVNVHDNYRPTGMVFKHPNFFTAEGIRGNEYITNNGNHTTLLPFTRFLTGEADYTNCYFGNDPDYNKPSTLGTTRAHQLALSILFYSPLQHIFWYGAPHIYQIEVETELFKEIPTVWDDYIMAGADMGKYISLARKKNDVWYLATISNNESRDLIVSLDFLDPQTHYSVTIYEDDGKKSIAKTTTTLENLKADGQLTTEGLSISMKASGGHVCVFRPKDVSNSLENRVEIEEAPLVIYPNPTQSGRVNYRIYPKYSGEESISIYSMDGRFMLQQKANGDFCDSGVDVSSLLNGVYQFCITFNGRTLTQKLIVNE